MIVTIDIGNTRIKWGVHDAGRWLAQGALLTVDVAHLSEVAAENWPTSAPIVACNVAGVGMETRIGAMFAGRVFHWLRAGANACGVQNTYEQPEKLGADRWAALIAAQGRPAGNRLVVCAGTATTADWLDADGLFRGGLILPGSDLMRSALATNTAQLPLAEGRCQEMPRNTQDAITTGCLFAQLGAIERFFALLPPGAVCLLTGGAASCLAPHLKVPHVFVDNLILEGLVRFAALRLLL